jgi:HAD superfamily phosphatase (TIGR01668 family)
MLRAPVPDLLLPSVLALTPEELRRRGVKLLLLDLDNTLAPYGVPDVTPEVRRWLADVAAAGIEPYIFSNNRGGRPAAFAEKLGLGFVGRAKKPNPRRLRALLAEKGLAESEAALVGDQIYTDIFCARRAGILAVAVRPIDARAPHRALRWAAESPFRLAAKLQGRDRL